jgi:dsDNA-specific endonuclease/ATPase MutS2
MRAGGITFTTTHHAELKEEAENDAAFVIAAVGFNTETLFTYKLEWGVLGNSNALAVVQSIGFDRKYCGGGTRQAALVTG